MGLRSGVKSGARFDDDPFGGCVFDLDFVTFGALTSEGELDGSAGELERDETGVGRELPLLTVVFRVAAPFARATPEDVDASVALIILYG